MCRSVQFSERLTETRAVNFQFIKHQKADLFFGMSFIICSARCHAQRLTTTTSSAVLIVFFLLSAFFGSSTASSLSCIVPFDGPNTGPVFASQRMQSIGTLIGTPRGLFLFDAVSGKLDPVDGHSTGAVGNIALLHDGSALVGSEIGVFRFDPSSRRVALLQAGEVGRVESIHPLHAGGALFFAQGELFFLMRRWQKYNDLLPRRIRPQNWPGHYQEAIRRLAAFQE
jgi:hypothetical protein